jgi:hypothetical protein
LLLSSEMARRVEAVLLGFSERVLVEPRIRICPHKMRRCSKRKPRVRRARACVLEIWQASFAQPARVVANVSNDRVFRIEAGAARWWLDGDLHVRG